MSDENAPSEDTPKEPTKSVVDRLLARALAMVEEGLSTGGKKAVRHTCAACGKRDTVEVDIGQDLEQLAKITSMLSTAQARMGKEQEDTSAAAVKLMHDRSEMTDAELAEYIAKLEAELA